MKKKLISIIVMSIALVSASNVMTVQAENTQVEDTTPPVIKGAKNRTIYKGYKTNLLSGVSAKDDVDGKVKVRVTKYKDKVGKQRITYTAKDSAGNVAKKTVVLTVKKDTKKPVIEGVKKSYTVYEDEAINLLKGVKATDNADKNVKVSVSNYNKGWIGKKQKIVFTAKDDMGNVTKKTAYITVLRKDKWDIIMTNPPSSEEIEKEIHDSMVDGGWYDENGNKVVTDSNFN